MTLKVTDNQYCRLLYFRGFLSKILKKTKKNRPTSIAVNRSSFRRNSVVCLQRSYSSSSSNELWAYVITWLTINVSHDVRAATFQTTAVAAATAADDDDHGVVAVGAGGRTCVAIGSQ